MTGARPPAPSVPAEPFPTAPATPVPTGPQPAELPTPTTKSPKPTVARKRRAQLLPAPDTIRQVSGAERVALATYEAELGGRSRLVEKLAHAQLDKAGGRFVQMLADPQHDALSLAEICALTATPIAKVTGWISASLMAKSTLLATMHIAAGLPDVAKGVMDDAIPGIKTCVVCNGTTKVEGPEPDKPMDCPACQGRGVRYFEADNDVRKMALALGGLLAPSGSAKGGVSIVNNNLALAAGGAAGASAGLDRITELTDRLLYGVGRDRLAGADDAADAEFVEGEVAP